MTQSKWTEYNGPVPKDLGIIPLGRVGHSENGYWVKRVQDGRIFTAPMVKRGLGAASVGDAVEITAKQADDACTCNTGQTNDGFASKVPPADVQTLLSPGYGPGYTTRYAQYKTGASAEIWRLSYPEDFAWCTCVDPTLIPIGPVTQGGGGGGGGTTTTGQSTASKVLPWILGAVGVAAVGTIAYVATRKPKRSHASESRRRRRRR
jgi:hypothetical protein